MPALLSYLLSLAAVYLLLSNIVSSFLELWNAYSGRIHKRKIFLREMLEKALTDEKSNLVAELYRHPQIAQQLSGTDYMPSAIDGQNFADALFSIIAEKTVDVGATASDRVSVSNAERFVQGIALVNSYKQQQFLYSLLPSGSDSSDRADAIKANIVKWFDAYMARISGEYKRRQKKPLFVIALLVAMVLNVNGLTLFQDLWHNQNAQKALEAKITMLAAQGSMPTYEGENPKELMDSVTRELNRMGLPIGINPGVWKACFTQKEPFQSGTESDHPGFLGIVWNYIRLLSGYILAAMLMRMGAPFWWDVINKIINLRSVGTSKK
jgi:hypothetical protein